MESDGRENASTAFARESRAVTGGSEGPARGKHAREREERERTAEGSSEKDLIRMEGNGRATRWWCTRPLRRCCMYVRGSSYGYLCIRVCERMYACPTVCGSLLLARSLSPEAGWGSHGSILRVQTHIRMYYVYTRERRREDEKEDPKTRVFPPFPPRKLHRFSSLVKPRTVYQLSRPLASSFPAFGRTLSAGRFPRSSCPPCRRGLRATDRQRR